jgi:hypothetical protein
MEDELKWMTRRFTWIYIPHRYQALSATIVSALLYFNLWSLFFEMQLTGSTNAGTLLRPIMEDDSIGWFWDSGVSLFTMNESLRSPRQMQIAWWEFLGTFLGLAICGLVLRRAIKRMPPEHRDATKDL